MKGVAHIVEKTALPRRAGAAAFELANAGIRVAQGFVLDQDGLHQRVKRIAARAACPR